MLMVFVVVKHSAIRSGVAQSGARMVNVSFV